MFISTHNLLPIPFQLVEMNSHFLLVGPQVFPPESFRNPPSHFALALVPGTVSSRKSLEKVQHFAHTQTCTLSYSFTLGLYFHFKIVGEAGASG